MAPESGDNFVLRVGSRDFTLVGREVVIVVLGVFAILGATVAMVAFEWLACLYPVAAKDAVPAIIALATPLLTAIYVNAKALADSINKRRADREAAEAKLECDTSCGKLEFDPRRVEQEKDR